MGSENGKGDEAEKEGGGRRIEIEMGISIGKRIRGQA